MFILILQFCRVQKLSSYFFESKVKKKNNWKLPCNEFWYLSSTCVALAPLLETAWPFVTNVRKGNQIALIVKIGGNSSICSIVINRLLENKSRLYTKLSCLQGEFAKKSGLRAIKKCLEPLGFYSNQVFYEVSTWLYKFCNNCGCTICEVIFDEQSLTVYRLI